jgi:hypothetical protein
LAGDHKREHPFKELFGDVQEAIAVYNSDELDIDKGGGGDNNIHLKDWLEEGKPLDYVPVGQFADRVFEFIEKNREEPSVVLSWKDRNTVALREFWAYSAGDCDTIKREIEAIVNAPIAGGTNE